jgi:hypothetical protein
MASLSDRHEMSEKYGDATFPGDGGEAQSSNIGMATILVTTGKE